MRRSLALLTLVALALTPTALADLVQSEGASTAGGMRWTWFADYDTDTKDLSFNCVLVNADTGTPVAVTETMIARVNVTLANGQQRLLDCLPIMNLGVQTDRTNLKVDTVGRWSGFYINTSFRP
jgi:hypothetical protein